MSLAVWVDLSMEQAPLRILLIEDNPADVVLTRMTLEESGRVHELMAIGAGEAALAHLREANPPPDLIVLDLNLPKIDGFAVLEQLRGMPTGGQVPVGFLRARNWRRIANARSNSARTRFWKNQGRSRAIRIWRGSSRACANNLYQLKNWAVSSDKIVR
jgi:CheY-like chemotaxis protein